MSHTHRSAPSPVDVADTSFGLALIYLLLGIGYLLDTVAVIKASGYVGIITAFIAYYTVAEVLYKASGVMALYVRQRWCLADPRTPSS